MARRRHHGPPLYDLITTRSQTAANKQQHAERRETLDEQGPEPLGWINPGRKIAFPVGYVFLAIAIALTITVLAFVFGHERGEDDAEGQFDRTLLDTTRAADQARQTEDPLLAARTGTFEPAITNRGNTNTISNQPDSDSQPQATRSRSTNSTGIGPIRSDPQQKGHNYYVLATTRLDGALRLASFCRDRGLEAYVVGGHNARLSQVIALPALKSTSPSDPLTRSLRELILRIGREWERSEPGATDLSDAHMQLKK